MFRGEEWRRLPPKTFDEVADPRLDHAELVDRGVNLVDPALQPVRAIVVDVQAHRGVRLPGMPTKADRGHWEVHFQPRRSSTRRSEAREELAQAAPGELEIDQDMV